MSKKNMMLILQALTICSLLHISTANTSSRGDRRSSSRSTRTSRVPQSDIRQVEGLLNTLKKDPKNTTWRNETTKKIQDIKKIDYTTANRYQKQYDSITRGVAIESKAQFIKRQLDTQLNMLKRNPGSTMWRKSVMDSINELKKEDSAMAISYQKQYDAIVRGTAIESKAQLIKRQLDTQLSMLKKNPNSMTWQKQAQENIDALENEDPNLANEYQAQFDMILGKNVQPTPVLPKESVPTIEIQIPESDIRQMERVLGLLKKNPTSTLWRNAATRYIKIIENSSPITAADYQKQYDAIVSGIAVESKTQVIKKQLDTELMMLKRTPTSTMWQQKVKDNIEALRNEDQALADNYQAQFDAIMQM